MFRECSVTSWSLNKTIRWLVTLSFPRAYNPPFPLSPSFAMPQWVADYRSCTFGLDDTIFLKKKIRSSYPSKEHRCFLKKMRFVTFFFLWFTESTSQFALKISSFLHFILFGWFVGLSVHLFVLSQALSTQP